MKRGIFPNPSRIALVLLLLLVLLPESSFSAPVGAIQGLSGAVYFKTKDAKSWVEARKGTSFNVGDRIRTGSDGRAELFLKDSTKLSLGNDTELEITSFLLKKKERSSVYSLARGKMRALVGGFSGTTDIKVRTPTSVSGVKGTEFIVMNSGEANVLFGKSDIVEVRGLEGKTVRLPPDRMTENTRGGSPIEPVSVGPGTPLEEARKHLEALTDVRAPVEWEKAGQLPNILARWNINYGHYLADSRRYAEALEVFQIAIDLSEITGLKAEAHIERGTVFSRNLNEPRSALAEYTAVIENYPEPPHLENALFSAGFVNIELGEKEKALEYFKRYLEEFPGGRHAQTIEILMRELEKKE